MFPPPLFRTKYKRLSYCLTIGLKIWSIPLLNIGKPRVSKIDLDFAPDSCDEVMRFLHDRYGEDKVASIGRFGTNKTKGTIRDMCKVLDIDLDEADHIAKSFGEYEIGEIDAMIAGDTPAASDAVEAIGYVRRYGELFDYVRKLSGLPKSFGLHPCFTGDMMVQTKDGNKPIKDVKVGDEVLTHKGRYRRVFATSQTVSDSLMRIKALGVKVVECTPNHQILARKKLPTEYNSFSEPSWVQAKDLTRGDLVATVSNKGCLWTYIKAVTGPFPSVEPVYDLTVEDDSSYTVQNVIVHNCGKVIATRELDYYMPSCYDKDGIRFLQGDMHDVEDLGLVKIDVLGLRTLDQEFDTLEMSGESPDFISPKQDFGDEKVLDIFRKGDTVGIFQMASYGMKDTLKKMDVSGINDLAIANALYRPGSMAYIDNFCRRRMGKEAVEYIHPDLEPILNYTYGIIVFQEQLIEIGRMAGMTNSDDIRRATAKKKPELLAKVKPELQTKLMARGWSEEQFDRLWGEMLDFAKYSFNKCVTGDTRLLFNGYSLSVEELYRWASEGISLADHRAWSATEGGLVVPNVIQNISEAGVRQVYKLTATDGASIECTLNHKFPTPSGEKKLSELHIGDELYAVRRVIEDCPAWLERYVVHVRSIRPTRTVMIYDVTMAGPNHNFVTDTGLVVSNSHASAYAIIAYMTAKQKAYYPNEFFAGLCNSYIGESSFVKDTAGEIMADAFRHGVMLAPFDFRQDHRRCTVSGGKMFYGVPLIKDCGIDTADALYALRDMPKGRFWPIALKAVGLGINKTVLRTLIKLGFFGEFGNARMLLRMTDFLERMKFGATKGISKSKLEGDEMLREIVALHGSDVGKNGKTLQKYAIADPAPIFDDVEARLHATVTEDFDLKARFHTQQEYLGFIGIATGREEDRPKLYVKAVFPAVRHRDNKIFGYNVKATSVGSGKENTWTVFLRQFQRDPIREGDIIFCDRYTKNGKYFNLDMYHRIL